MADVLEEFNRLHKAVVELDKIVLEKNTRKVDAQLTTIKSSLVVIKSSLVDIKPFASGNMYRLLCGYLDEVLTWMEFQLRGREWVPLQSNASSLTKFLSYIGTKLLAPDNLGVSSKNVFIVHGRDLDPMNELRAMLLGFGLKPIVLHEQPSGSRTIVEKLERYSDVGYTFVVLTPDDIRVTSNKEEEEYAHSISAKMTDCTVRVFKAREKGDMRKVEEIRDEFIKHAIDFQGHVENLLGSFELRARQNVILEFGYFIGLLNRDRVCCLLKGNVERPSDMHGIVYVAFKRSINEVRNMIIKELKEAGYEIKL